MGILVKLVLNSLRLRLTPGGVTVPPVIPEQPVTPPMSMGSFNNDFNSDFN